jgi:hypothetical protein
MDDDSILALVTRLARPHRSGGQVIERAAILAAGPDSSAVLAWIRAHAGEPEQAVSAAPTRGLHGARISDVAGTPRAPQRLVLPAGVLQARARQPPATETDSRRKSWQPSTR